MTKNEIPQKAIAARISGRFAGRRAILFYDVKAREIKLLHETDYPQRFRMVASYIQDNWIEDGVLTHHREAKTVRYPMNDRVEVQE